MADKINLVWEREAGIEPSIESISDSYVNALSENIIGLYRPKVIRWHGPWRSFEAVDFVTVEWVNRFNNRVLLDPIGNILPAEAAERYYAMMEHSAIAT